MSDPTDLPVPDDLPAPRRRNRRVVALVTGAALTLVGALALTGTAVAAPGGTTATTTAAAASGAGAWAQLDCTDLQRVHTTVQDRVTLMGADASVHGSTAWVQAHVATATAAGKTARAARLQKLLDARAAHPDRWQRVLTRVEGAEATACS